LLFFCLFLFTNFQVSKKTKIYSFNKIEKNWTSINENLLANKFEVTNLEYQVFLQSIDSDAKWVDRKDPLKIRNDNWNQGGIKKEHPWQNEWTDLSTYYHLHPFYHQYPVVNISQEAAKAFCEWLTIAYNNKSNRKYKKVLIRLPSEQEWVIAARAGNQHAPFPWGGYYLRNGQGEFLANFGRVDEGKIKVDRNTGQIEMSSEEAFVEGIPASVNNYYANNFGLYNTSGNVAEMLAEEGRTKGGSWASSGYYIRIDVEDEYAGFQEPSPFIGFRYFIDVVEE